MDTEARAKAVMYAKRLQDSDGPHLRNWARNQPEEFTEAVHCVAELALTAPGTYAPPDSGTQKRAPYTRGRAGPGFGG